MQNILAELKQVSIPLIASGVLILLSVVGVLNPIKSVLQQISLPISFGIYQMNKNITGQFQFITVSRETFNQNRALNTQLMTVLSENAQLRKQIDQLQSDVNQQNKLSFEVYELIPAKIHSVSRFMTIEVGTNQGVKSGMVVVSNNNFVGIVKDVYPRSARVQLLSDPDSKIAAFSQGKTGRARGLVVGQFGSNLKMEKILHQEIIEQGDFVYSEGTEGSLPRGLVLGVVEKVSENPNDVFKTAEIKSLINFLNLDIVYLIGAG